MSFAPKAGLLLHLDLSTPGCLAAHTFVADAFRRHGAVPSIEFSHSGQYQEPISPTRTRRKVSANGVQAKAHARTEGRKVYLVEMGDTLAPDCNIRNRPILMKNVDQYAKVHKCHTGLEITAEGLVCKDSEGNEVLIKCDTVICAVGQRSNRTDVDILRRCAPFVHEIGDCIRPANITKAIYEGYHAALDI